MDGMGVFYLVATPIGNLEDFSPRAARVLREADLVLCEDTRHSAKLMQASSAHAPLLSCHEYNERDRLTRVIAELQSGRKVALVSDAGTPGISDPGFFLVRELRALGFRVESIPGACAAIVALSASGLPTDRFTFLGFPPETPSKRRTFFAQVAGMTHTLIFYLSPHKAARQLADAAEAFGPRRACLARELTKLYETFMDGTLPEIAERVANEAPKGELVLLVAGAEASEPAEALPPEELIVKLREDGLTNKEIVSALCKTLDMPRQEAYRLVHAEAFANLDEPEED